MKSVRSRKTVRRTNRTQTNSRCKPTEDALRTSETKFRSLFQNVLDGVYQTLPDGKLITANPALVRMLGYQSEKELLEVDIARQFYRNPAERQDLTQKLEQQGEMHSAELVLTRKDGRLLIVLDNAHVVRDEQGKVLYYEGTLTDITERKQAEQALARHAAILDAVMFAAERFLRARSWQNHIANVIERLGQATRVSRVYIFQNLYTQDHTLIWKQLYEWVDPATVPQIDNPLLQHLPVVEGGFGRWVAVMESGDLIHSHVRDLPLSEQRELVAEDIKSIVCVPIFVKQVWWGFIGFDECVAEREWSMAEIDALRAAADTLSAAIEREQADHELVTRASELEVLRQAGLSLTSSLDRTIVLEAIVESALRLTPGAQDAHIYLYRDNRLTFGTSLWSDGRRALQWAEPRPDGLTYNVARKGEPIVVEDMKTHPLFENLGWEGAILGLPLKVAQRVVGVLTIACSQPRPFSENELRTLNLLGTQAAVAIENAWLYDRVQQMAITDPLTGAYNRRGFLQFSEREFERSCRFGHPLSVLILDVDHFKQVNDTYGHLFGDKVLCALVDDCRRHLRAFDFIGRHGGEEFVVLLPEADAAKAQRIAQRLCESVAQLTVPHDARNISITISVGVACMSPEAADLAALIQRADRALYRAKDAGRNRIELFERTQEMEATERKPR